MIRRPFNLRASGDVLNLASSADFRVRVSNSKDALELMVYGEIGDPYNALDAKSVAGVLTANRGKPVNVRINSPGGLAYDGISIYNALVNHNATVDVAIEGIAASAASIIAMAGNTIRIAENGSLMIHRAWGLAAGNRKVMLDLADFLGQLDEQIADTYAARTGHTRKRVLSLMDGKVDGTTFSGPDAVKEGFADAIIPLKRTGKNASPIQRSVSARMRMLQIDQDNEDAARGIASRLARTN